MSGIAEAVKHKAITTHYNGYKFRSRLEARWAVFFDAAGLAYEYEKEGFELSTGDSYLPDFWLPGLQIWFEVKPSGGELGSDTCRKLIWFSREIAGIIIATGDPWYSTELTYLPHGDKEIYDVLFGHNFVTDDVLITSLCLQGETSDSEMEVLRKACTSQKIRDAFNKARGARFEHGEKG